MSQDYFSPDAGSSTARDRSASPSKSSSSRSQPPGGGSPRKARFPDAPRYMTVGSGSTPASAAALTAMLDNDSGYEGSAAMGYDQGSSHRLGGAAGWDPGQTIDMPTPPHVPVLPGEINAASEHERRVLASHVHQLYYNQNRLALGRAINRTVDTLKGLQDMNSTWPAHYPSVQRPETTVAPHRIDPRPGLVHTQSTADTSSRSQASAAAPARPSELRRAFTSGADENPQAESSAAAEGRTPVAEPRLITPQIAEEFSILKIDLKLGALSQAELVHSLEKHSIASLLDGKISHSIRHLLSLRDRIEDTSSKVLVTGDLNAGKSTFCNALLRRKVLPEDQQPCTSIFCEVLDARENGGVEEVHAVHKDTSYNRHDESTYDVYGIPELEKIVVDNDRYTQAKVYVKDARSIDESLLNNGVVDISIIDAPGLNADSVKTTAVFARQEEIDVVVFVVSAANHFTLSSTEFIRNAAREKAYIFIVVNGFDNIRDTERCQKEILKQVATLSPRTFKESSELVHFVSSNAIPIPRPPVASNHGGGGGDGGGGGGSGGADGGDSSSPPDNDDPPLSDEPTGKHGSKGDDPPKKDKGKAKESLRDFSALESALRRFVLEKRARSKLAPAKTYLLNLLSDINTLATVNHSIASSELSRVNAELSDLEPVFQQSKKARAEVSEDIDRTIEDTCASIYTYTRTTLTRSIDLAGDSDLGVPYPGLLNAWSYAEELKTAMVEQIAAAVTECEAHARDETVSGVASITSLGQQHLGDEYTEMSFRSDIMFRRRRDVLARQVDGMTVEVWDFLLDPRSLIPSFLSLSPSLPFSLSPSSDSNNNKQLSTTQTTTAGLSMTVLGLFSTRLLNGSAGTWFSHSLSFIRILSPSRSPRALLLPGLSLALVGSLAVILHFVPAALPHRLSHKLHAALADIDYTHAHSQRISSEVRKILRFPADTLRVGLQRSVEKLVQRRDDTEKVRGESEVARRYFGNLVREVGEVKRGVEGVDLEGAAPGVAGGYEA